jgi:hypothetical protein
MKKKNKKKNKEKNNKEEKEMYQVLTTEYLRNCFRIVGTGISRSETWGSGTRESDKTLFQ